MAEKNQQQKTQQQGQDFGAMDDSATRANRDDSMAGRSSDTDTGSDLGRNTGANR